MKKALSFVLTLALGVTCMAAVSACTQIPQESADQALETLDALYGSGIETPSNYELLSRVLVANGTTVSVNWSAKTEQEGIDLSKYVSIGSIKEDGYRTLSIKRATVDIEYTLTASISTGLTTGSSKTYSAHIPAGEDRGDVETEIKSLSFDNAETDRKEFSTTKQVWEANGIKLTNTGSVGDYTNPVRLYKNSVVQIESDGIIRIDFHTQPEYDDNPYVTALEQTLQAAYPDAQITSNVENKLVSLELGVENPTSIVEFTCTVQQLRLDSIDVERLVGGLSDEKKVEAAAGALSVVQTSFFEPNTVALPTEQSGASVSWALKETSQYATVENNTLKITSLPEDETTVTLVATLTVGEETATKEITVTLKPSLGLEHTGTAESPYTATEALAIMKALASDAYYMKDGAVVKVYVTGYIVNAGTYSTNYSNYEGVYIAEQTKDPKSSFQVFRLTPDGTLVKKGDTLQVGAQVVLTGYLQNFKGNTPELTYNAENPTFVEYTLPSVAEQIENALATVEATLTVNTLGEKALATSPFSAVTFSWAVKETDGNTLPEGITLENNVLKVTKLPAEEKTVVLVVTATAEGTDAQTKEVTVTFKPESTEEKGDGTVNHPYSVAEILEVAKDVASGSFLQVDGQNAKVYVKGYVTDVGYIFQTYGLSTVKIADEKGGSPEFKLYTVNWGDAMEKPDPIPSASPLTVGDYVVCYGFVKNFNGELEIDKYSSNYPTFTTWEKVGGSVDPDPKPPVPQGELLYTLTSTTKGTGSSVSSYTDSSPCTVDGIVWDVLGNTQIGTGQYDIPNWRFGGKSSNCVGADRTITGRGVITGTVKSIIITFGATSSSITVNSVTLKVYDKDPGADSPEPIAQETVEWEENGTYTVTAEGAGWKDCYYQLVMNLTSSAEKNKWIVVDNIAFYGETGGTVTPKPDAEKVNEALNGIKLSKTQFTTEGEQLELPQTSGEVNFQWEVQDNKDYATIEGGTLRILKLPEGGDVTVKLKVTASLNGASNNKDVEIIVKAKSTEEPAAEEKIYSLNGTEQPVGTNNAYAQSCEVTYNGVTWVVEGNAKVDSGGAQKPWRFGGKNISGVDRKLSAKTAVSGKVTKIVLNLTDGGSITINSVTLKVYKSDPTVAGAVATSEKSITYTKDTDVTIEAGAEDDWTDCYFQLVFNVTVGSSNKYVSISKLEFWGVKD